MIPTASRFNNPLLDGLSLKSPKALEIIMNPPTTYTLNSESKTSLTFYLNNTSITAWADIED